MKAINLIIILGLSIAYTSSCQNAKKQDGIIHLELNSIPTDNAPYQVSRMVPLETTAENLIGEYLMVKTQGNNIFIYDENARDAIHRFDMKGQYHGKAVEVGEGPGMVRNILDFVPTDQGLEVLIGMGDYSKILIFDQDFNLDKEIALDYQASSFEKSSQGKYVLSGSYNHPFVTHRVVVLNAEGDRLKEFLPNNYSNQMMPMQERY